MVLWINQLEQRQLSVWEHVYLLAGKVANQTSKNIKWRKRNHTTSMRRLSVRANNTHYGLCSMHDITIKRDCHVPCKYSVIQISVVFFIKKTSPGRAFFPISFWMRINKQTRHERRETKNWSTPITNSIEMLANQSKCVYLVFSIHKHLAHEICQNNFRPLTTAGSAIEFLSRHASCLFKATAQKKTLFQIRACFSPPPEFPFAVRLR